MCSIVQLLSAVSLLASVLVCEAGVTMLLASHSDDSDMLWLISSDNFPFRPLVSESHVSTVCNVFYCQ